MDWPDRKAIATNTLGALIIHTGQYSVRLAETWDRIEKLDVHTSSKYTSDDGATLAHRQCGRSAPTALCASDIASAAACGACVPVSSVEEC
jgi:hypothetical protein